MTNEKKVKSRVRLSALSHIIIIVHNINNRYIRNHHSAMNYHNMTVSTMRAYAEYRAPKNMILYRTYASSYIRIRLSNLQSPRPAIGGVRYYVGVQPKCDVKNLSGLGPISSEFYGQTDAERKTIL